MFANEYDVENWHGLFTGKYPNGVSPEEAPNLARAAQTLSQFKDWTNMHSDGWAYWKKPLRASQKLVELLHQGEARLYSGPDEIDCSSADLKKALTPIKSFLTRQGEDWHEILPQ